MSGNNNNGEVISKEEAKEMINLYQENNPDKTKSVLYDAELILAMLNQTGVTGIRMYMGETESGGNTIILVGADASGNDLADLMVVGGGKCCPLNCPASSYFN